MRDAFIVFMFICIATGILVGAYITEYTWIWVISALGLIALYNRWMMEG